MLLEYFIVESFCESLFVQHKVHRIMHVLEHNFNHCFLLEPFACRILDTSNGVKAASFTCIDWDSGLCLAAQGSWDFIVAAERAVIFTWRPRLQHRCSAAHSTLHHHGESAVGIADFYSAGQHSGCFWWLGFTTRC